MGTNAVVGVGLMEGGAVTGVVGEVCCAVPVFPVGGAATWKLRELASGWLNTTRLTGLVGSIATAREPLATSVETLNS
jgi:hypothetical protein